MYHDSGDGEPGCSQVTLTDVSFSACGKFTECNQRGHENRALVSLLLLLDTVASRTSCFSNWEFSKQHGFHSEKLVCNYGTSQLRTLFKLVRVKGQKKTSCHLASPLLFKIEVLFSPGFGKQSVRIM